MPSRRERGPRGNRRVPMEERHTEASTAVRCRMAALLVGVMAAILAIALGGRWPISGGTVGFGVPPFPRLATVKSSESGVREGGVKIKLPPTDGQSAGEARVLAASTSSLPPRDPESLTQALWVSDKDRSVLIYVSAGMCVMCRSDAREEEASRTCNRRFGECEAWLVHERYRRPAVYLPAYWVGRQMVTNAQYARFVEAGGYARREHWTLEGWATKQAKGITRPEPLG